MDWVALHGSKNYGWPAPSSSIDPVKPDILVTGGGFSIDRVRIIFGIEKLFTGNAYAVCWKHSGNCHLIVNYRFEHYVCSIPKFFRKVFHYLDCRYLFSPLSFQLLTSRWVYLKIWPSLVSLRRLSFALGSFSTYSTIFDSAWQAQPRIHPLSSPSSAVNSFLVRFITLGESGINAIIRYSDGLPNLSRARVKAPEESDPNSQGLLSSLPIVHFQ